MHEFAIFDKIFQHGTEGKFYFEKEDFKSNYDSIMKT
jgi:hypothetical protein